MQRISRLLNPADARRSSVLAIIGLALFGLVLVSAATAEIAAPTGHQTISIRIVDEQATSDSKQGPQGDDRVQPAVPGAGHPALWLKREGQISGDIVAEARVVSGHNGRSLIALTLTPEAAAKFEAMTRDNVGHRLAIVVDNRIITAPVVREPITGGRVEIDGRFTSEKAARAVIADIMGTGRDDAR